MRRSSVLKLRSEQWLPVHPDSDLEVCIVPSAGTTLPGLRRSMLTDIDKMQICQTVFTDFKNYTDDQDKQVPNTMQARLELIDVSAVFYAIQTRVSEVQTEIFVGEESAVSA